MILEKQPVSISELARFEKIMMEIAVKAENPFCSLLNVRNSDPKANH
jgi:hypothetical protein